MSTILPKRDHRERAAKFLGEHHKVPAHLIQNWVDTDESMPTAPAHLRDDEHADEDEAEAYYALAAEFAEIEREAETRAVRQERLAVLGEIARATEGLEKTDHTSIRLWSLKRRITSGAHVHFSKLTEPALDESDRELLVKLRAHPCTGGVASDLEAGAKRSSGGFVEVLQMAAKLLRGGT